MGTKPPFVNSKQKPPFRNGGQNFKGRFKKIMKGVVSEKFIAIGFRTHFIRRNRTVFLQVIFLNAFSFQIPGNGINIFNIQQPRIAGRAALKRLARSQKQIQTGENILQRSFAAGPLMITLFNKRCFNIKAHPVNQRQDLG